MRIDRITLALAIVLAAFFLVGANSGSRYEIEAFPFGKNRMGAVRLDLTTGEICFFGAQADVYLPGGVIEESRSGKLTCAN